MRHVSRRLAIALVLVASSVAFVSARQAGATKASTNPIADSLKSFYDIAKDFVTKSAQQFAEADYAFKPAGVVAEVKNFGQLVGHIANSNYMMCGAATAPPPPAGTPEKKLEERGPGGVDYEKTTAKAALQKALAESFAFCDKAFAFVNDRNGGQPVAGLPIGTTTRLGALSFNNAHLMEHYGNFATYMRIKGMVPPSSQGTGR